MACLCALPLCCFSNVRNNLSDTLTNHDRYDNKVNEHVTTHTRPQVNVLTLGLTSLLCSTGIAALRRCKHFRFLHGLLLSASSGVSLSFLSLYCSLLCRIRSSISIQHEQWTPPSINQLTRAKTVIYSDNSP